jgi:hypothetical protein
MAEAVKEALDLTLEISKRSKFLGSRHGGSRRHYSEAAQTWNDFFLKERLGIRLKDELRRATAYALAIAGAFLIQEARSHTFPVGETWM